MFNDPLIDGHESQADFNDEIQTEADSGLPAICVCDFPDGSATITQREKMDGHYNEAGGFCCPHWGNTCGHCNQHDR